MYRRSITIDYTKVSTADQADFPVYFFGTYSYLAHTSHGGKVQSASGYDIWFSSDETGLAVLDHEIEAYNHETGAIAAWIRIPSLSHTVDTVIYLQYGDPNVTSSKENINGVWDSNYKAVWHCIQAVGEGLWDSTDNDSDLTTSNYEATIGHNGSPAVISNVSRCAYNDDLASFWNGVAAGGKITIECWLNALTNAYTDGMSNWDGTGAFGFLLNNYVISSFTLKSGTIRYRNFTALSQDSWHHIQITLDATTSPNTTIAHMRNGASDDQAYGGSGNGISTSTKGFALGRNLITGFFNGCFDEVRISDILRDPSWEITNYNNQDSPSTFYELGDEVEYLISGSFWPIILRLLNQ